MQPLTRLTWLIHTSVLPSNWNLGHFALKSQLGQVHMVREIFLIFLHAGAIFFKFILLTSFEENHKFSNKNNNLPAWRKIRNSVTTVRAKILPLFQFEGKTDVWICQVRRVNTINFISIHWLLFLFSWKVQWFLLMKLPTRVAAVAFENKTSFFSLWSAVYKKCQKWFWMFEAYLKWNFYNP